MKYFLDSAKIEEIRYAYRHWGIDGVTTNPRHIMNSQKGFLEVLSELAEEFRGIEFPISVEINPHLDDAVEMIQMAREISQLSPNFIIKIPCCEQGLIASKVLEEEGIRTNVTLVFSSSQAIAAAKMKAHFVSPFVGWKESSGEDGMSYIKDIVDIYKKYDIQTEIIVASVRSGAQIVKAALAGADIVTCGMDVYKDSFKHPFTNQGLDIFIDAWDRTKVD